MEFLFIDFFVYRLQVYICKAYDNERDKKKKKKKLYIEDQGNHITESRKLYQIFQVIR